MLSVPIMLIHPFQMGEHDYDGKATHDAINSLYPVLSDGRARVRAIFVKTDVSLAAEVENLVNECVRIFGRLDMCVVLFSLFSFCGRCGAIC